MKYREAKRQGSVIDVFCLLTSKPEKLWKANDQSCHFRLSLGEKENHATSLIYSECFSRPM